MSIWVTSCKPPVRGPEPALMSAPFFWVSAGGLAFRGQVST